MSAREFALHQAYMRRIPTGWEGATQMWSRLMAALLNGPSPRKDKRAWTADHFAADPWGPAAAKKSGAPSVSSLKAFVSGLVKKRR